MLVIGGNKHPEFRSPASRSCPRDAGTGRATGQSTLDGSSRCTRQHGGNGETSNVATRLGGNLYVVTSLFTCSRKDVSTVAIIIQWQSGEINVSL